MTPEEQALLDEAIVVAITQLRTRTPQTPITLDYIIGKVESTAPEYEAARADYEDALVRLAGLDTIHYVELELEGRPQFTWDLTPPPEEEEA